MPDSNEQRILICAPLGKDAELASHVLKRAGLECVICKTLTDLISALYEGAGLVLTVEEVLPGAASVPLSNYLSNQATWSDLPILVLTKGGGDPLWIKGAYERFGNLTLLERPVRAPTLISAARSALRARLRQYEIRVSDARKDEFLAMLAHELRNPLAPISAAAQLLELVSSDVEKVKNTSKIIGRQVSHMTSLIDDLLDVARVTRGLITLDEEILDVRHILAAAIEQVNPQFNARYQEFSVHMPDREVSVLGDSKRLIQVIANLLNNASKYTPTNGKIAAHLSLSGDDIVLKVTDNGIGIEPKMVSQVFDLFAQAERTSDGSQGGLGLGLALVKSLVLSHGGSVEAESKGSGQGSTFTIQIPHLKSETLSLDQLDPSSASSSPFQPLRLMIVDDNIDAADTLAMFLGTSGHEVSVEYGAKEAIVRAQATAPHVCILDIGLPDMDGNRLAAHLRSIPETAKAILIAVTGYSQEQDRKKAIESGFDYHFVKPVDVARLMNVIGECNLT